MEKMALENIIEYKQSMLKYAFEGELTDSNIIFKNIRDWKELQFSECVNKISIKHKIKQKHYLKNGKYPIIDQGQNFISGYSNDELTINIKKPVIVFGDHTRCFKFVDFDFIAGADGIKILEPKEFFNEKLFYYFCLILDFPNKGYSRHYQYLAKTIMRIPPLEIQKEIAARLDFSFDKIEKGIKYLKLAKENIIEYKQSMLKYAFEGKLTDCNNWEIKTLGDLYEITSSKRVFKKEWKKEGIPFYRARDIVSFSKNETLKNPLFISYNMYNEYSKKYGIPSKDDILVTGVGTIGIPYLVKENDRFYFKDGNIIWLKKRSNNIFSKYVYYLFFSNLLEFNSKGSTVLTYTIINAKNTKIPIPPIETQKEIVSILDKSFESAIIC